VKRLALWDLGFRPFYLLASLFAALSVALWAAQYSGWLPGAYLAGSVWHAHEMLFGYTMAVIAGFLFTAVGNWTQRPTPRGPLLAAFALLWIAGRVLVLTPYALAAAVVNAAFPLAVAAGSPCRCCRRATAATTSSSRSSGRSASRPFACTWPSWARFNGLLASDCARGSTSCSSSWP
jgi:uncharacterized protein involved in response to NO